MSPENYFLKVIKKPKSGYPLLGLVILCFKHILESVFKTFMQLN
ncbi:hypothetical protein P20429_0958 [Pseudoalteromonas sp. BSi20429]|nr:hypothetical protein P20429_0958 [Pseudoalteromonas sp. BSi20429]